jgi:cytochrome P450
MSQLPPLPVADGPTGLEILKGLLRDRSLLTALSLMYKYVGNAFQITLPRFKPAVLVGPETNRQILVRERHKLLWRNETDPVVKLLRRGVLVVDGKEHDDLRGIMDPFLQRRCVVSHISAFWSYTNQVTSAWQHNEILDMLVEMRKIALLILFGTLFKVDFTPDMERLWRPILDLIEYISPGFWIVFPKMPRHPKYSRARREMDEYLYNLIRRRRADLEVAADPEASDDLLSKLVSTPGMSDDLIRDQLLTMLIAGHDTSTALLAWTLFLLGKHPQAMKRTRDEVDAVLKNSDDRPSIGQINALVYTDQVIKEALRMYPPIHVGNRKALEDINLHGYHIPAETRVMYSIFLSHREEEHWHDPECFIPERFERQSGEHRPPFTYVPFGGGPRNCIGAAFAQVESKVVIARLLQLFNFKLQNGDEIRPYMGATLEPRPGVKMRVRRRVNRA